MLRLVLYRSYKRQNICPFKPISKNQIGMRRVFDRPVAIGFRGFDFEVTLNATTGKFISLKLLGITNSMMPRGPRGTD